MRTGQTPQSRPHEGFTLIELTLVIVITTILAAMMGSFMTAPMQGYQDVSRRAALVDAAESALHRMARDVRRAVPNTLRVSGDGRSMEFLHTLDGGRYREKPGTNPPPSNENHSAASDRLSFGSDSQFNVLGRLDDDNFTYGVALAGGSRLTIYPVSSALIYSHAENGTDPGLITPSGTTITITDDTDEDQITLSASYKFLFESPQARFFLMDTPVSYLCDLTAETLTRYAAYSVVTSQPTNPAIAPLDSASSALIANRVADCTFTYEAGASQRAGLVTMDLQIAENGEQIRLLHQVHVSNVP
jgi:MSHA biogenesis protein MshO